MKVAIVGSRKFPAMDAVRAYVRRLPKDTVIVSGAGPERRRELPREKWGVDEHAEDEAAKCGLPTISYPAQWKRPDGTVDRGAGFKRNGYIAEQCDRLVTFWDGKSRGTLDTIHKAYRMRRRIDVYTYIPGQGVSIMVTPAPDS